MMPSRVVFTAMALPLHLTKSPTFMYHLDVFDQPKFNVAPCKHSSHIADGAIAHQDTSVSIVVVSHQVTDFHVSTPALFEPQRCMPQHPTNKP
jgi:hypothetical protein